MAFLDTRDLVEKREELKQEVLDSFLEEFEHYAEQTESFEDILFEEEELENWKELWQEELNEIEAIDDLENEVCNGEFDSGTTLIEECDFEEYCEQFCEEVGYIDSNLPHWIEVDWKSTAENMKMDYTEVEYEGRTYLFR